METTKTGDGTYTGGGAKTGRGTTGKCKGSTRSVAPLEAARGGPGGTGMYAEDGVVNTLFEYSMMDAEISLISDLVD